MDTGAIPMGPPVAIPMGPPVAIQPGETWNFQAWYRDENPGSTTNLSAALAVIFR